MTIAALGTTLVLVSACGGDDGDSEETQAFRAGVNAVCAEYLPLIAALPPPLEEDEWAALGADIADLLETTANELALLEPTDDLAEDYDDWLVLRSEGVVAARDLQAAGGLHDDAGIADALNRIAEIDAEADALAAELGFADCESSPLESPEHDG